MTSFVEMDQKNRADKSGFRRLEDVLSLFNAGRYDRLALIGTTGVLGVGLIMLAVATTIVTRSEDSISMATFNDSDAGL